MSGVTDLISVGLLLLGEIIVFVVWLVRLEGRISYNEKRLEQSQEELHTLRIKHEALDSKIVEKLAEVEKALARIEGRLEAKSRDL